MSLTQILGLGFILAALLMALSRFRGRLTLTIKMRGRARMRRAIPPNCPHMGMADDPFRHGERPQEQHRCYLGMQRDRIDLAHQQTFCLSRSHVSCPWLSVVPGATQPSVGQRVADWAGPHAVALADSCWIWTCTSGWPATRAMLMRLSRLLGRHGVSGARGLRAAALWLVRSIAAQSRAAAPAIGSAVREVFTRRTRSETGDHAVPGESLDRDVSEERRAEVRTTSLEVSQPEPLAAESRSVIEAAASSATTPPSFAGKGAGGLGPLSSPTEDALLHEGLAALETGDEELAYARFVRATDVAPGSSRAWFWRAKTASSLAEVIRSLERASAIDPTNEKVRASLAHAVGRMEKTQERNRFAQPLTQEQATTQTGKARVGAGTEPRQALRPRTQPSRPGPLANFMRQVAGLACLSMATLWLAAALLPLARAVATAPAAAIPHDGARLATTYVDTVSSRLSVVPIGSIDAALGSGGSSEMTLAIPFVIGFLFLFVAGAVFQRDPSARFWASTLVSLQLGMGALSGSRDALTVSAAIGVAIALGLLLGRSDLQDQRRRPGPVSDGMYWEARS